MGGSVKQALVVGGGYAGVAAARVLAHTLPAEWAVTLADQRPRHELLTRLPEIVAGSIHPNLARIPYADILSSRVRFIETDVRDVNPDDGTAISTSGMVRWDALVLATGVQPALDPAVSGATHVFPLRSVDQAVAARDALASALEQRRLTRVVIIGAGYTGTEVAGELVALPDADRRLTVTMLADAPRVLPQGNAQLARLVDQWLRRNAIEMHLGIQIDAVTSHGVTLTNGQQYSADIILWAGQTSADARWGGRFRTAEAGRLRADEYLRAGRENVFAIGDGAAIAGVAANAQLAIEEGKLGAHNLMRSIRGEPMREFRARSLGEALSLGPEDGIADVLGVILTGRRAHAVKTAALVRYLFGLGGRPLVRRYAGPSGR